MILSGNHQMRCVLQYVTQGITQSVTEMCTSVLKLGKSTTGQNMSALADQLDALAGSCSCGAAVCIDIQCWKSYFYIHFIHIILSSFHSDSQLLKCMHVQSKTIVQHSRYIK